MARYLSAYVTMIHFSQMMRRAKNLPAWKLFAAKPSGAHDSF